MFQFSKQNLENKILYILTNSYGNYAYDDGHENDFGD